ncbi:MAG: HEAT repeat protein [Planctomycetota bacterium]|jgi:HEAT repeat protein
MLKRFATYILIAVFAAAGLARGAGMDAERDQLLLRVKDLGDRAPSEFFFSIAKDRNAEAFATLKEALAELKDPGSARAAFGACALFKGSAIEEPVINWLAKQTFKAETPAQQLGATQALTYFWIGAQKDLLHVLHNHSSRTCREIALEPMLPLLASRADRTSCKIILESCDPTGRGRAALIAALRQFTSPEAETVLAGKLRARGTSLTMKLLLLELFAERLSKVSDIAIDKRLDDENEDVRLMAIAILAERGDPDILRKLKTAAQKGSPRFITNAILELAVLREGDPTWISELYGFTRSSDAKVRAGAAAALGIVPTQEALALLHRLISDEDLEVQLSALRILAERRQVQSIPKLIAAMGDPQALVTHEIARTLRIISGRDHGVSRTRWQTWFEAEGSNLQIPTNEEIQELESQRDARDNPTGKYRTASFYGLKIRSHNVCFVIDTSGSMSNGASGRGTSSVSQRSSRIAVAQLEISNALNQLLNGVRFNIIGFESRVNSYQKSLITLDSKSRVRALKWVDALYSMGGTAIYDGLTLALRDEDVEAIYLLTDGTPTEGLVVDMDEIVDRIGLMTAGRDVRIHGVAIGSRSTLLKQLAKNSGGNYLEIF